MKRMHFLLIALLLVSCAKQGNHSSFQKMDLQVLEGKASWYGSRFHGRKTASGERYNMHAMTAAHKTLPFGTWANVTNLSNNRQSIVRINDRGPYISGRILDLSFEAARRLDMVKAGVSRIKIEVYQPASPEENFASPLPEGAGLALGSGNR